ncbi:hypothetical protein H5407_17140 [Mitsuaria sp. WAJ17]|uniref:hypothetical protein n=1 Tax=Mitsuaria sp. WAJ17 TaxID=2761452 RepID=UPI0016019AA9|nr:hypothetical protein [Mitsuaria sp. WAJ17]MBB2486957.1 hypothetical protein [Mitsuaria sp. WAJ17]
MSLPLQTWTGVLERRLLAAGSKSERQGLVLRLDGGQVLPVRRLGGNDYRDEALQALLGQRLQVQARQLQSGVLQIESWTMA